MRKTILAIVASVFTLILFNSCTKDYTCKCTYVAMSNGSAAGQPDKEETSNVKGNTSTLADVNCKMNEDKYLMQGFDGTCGIQ